MITALRAAERHNAYILISPAMLSRIMLLGIRPGSSETAAGSCAAAAALGTAAGRPCASAASFRCHETARLCSPAAPQQLHQLIVGAYQHASAYPSAQQCGSREDGDASNPPAAAAASSFRRQRARFDAAQRQPTPLNSSGIGLRSGCGLDSWRLPPPSRSISTHSAERRKQRSATAASSRGQDHDADASPADIQTGSRSSGRPGGQLRRWSAVVPGNGGKRGKGHSGEPQYDMGEVRLLSVWQRVATWCNMVQHVDSAACSMPAHGLRRRTSSRGASSTSVQQAAICFCRFPAQVLQKLRQPPLHNDILSQQGRQAEGYEWKVRRLQSAQGQQKTATVCGSRVAATEEWGWGRAVVVCHRAAVPRLAAID